MHTLACLLVHPSVHPNVRLPACSGGLLAVQPIIRRLLQYLITVHARQHSNVQERAELPHLNRGMWHLQRQAWAAVTRRTVSGGAE